MAKRDYYEVLGVAKDVSAKDMEASFRRLAMKYHPDRNVGDPEAEAKFKEVGEAYAVLSDAELGPLDYVDLSVPGRPAVGGAGHSPPPIPSG